MRLQNAWSVWLRQKDPTTTDANKCTPDVRTDFGTQSGTLEALRGLIARIGAGKKMARPERLELPTTWFEARYSIQLSYGRVIAL
jgi:hypothetical protein